MERENDAVTKERVVEARARNISHNVRCTECGSQSIEESQADVAILLRKKQRLCYHRGKDVYYPTPPTTLLRREPLQRYWGILMQLIRDQIKDGKSDKDIYKKLEEDFGETVLYTPKFDLQTAALWLSPLIAAGAAGGVWALKKHRQKTNVHIMALNLVRGVPLTPKEKETMLDILTPPPSEATPSSYWWRRFLPR